MKQYITYANLVKKNKFLEKELENQKRFRSITQTLFEISNAVNIASDLNDLFQSIHNILSSIIDTTNFFIALYDALNDSMHFPYCVDSVDASYPPVLQVSKTESLTAQVIQEVKPLMITKNEIIDRRKRTLKTIPSCTPSEIWLGVPLKCRDQVIGVMAVQSYSNVNCFDTTDLDIMVSTADQIAIAIDRKRAEIEREQLIVKLQTALTELKELKGIIPICSYCHKIRDDKGYWNQLELYLHKHSGASFSHGICEECAKKYYPDMDLYDD